MSLQQWFFMVKAAPTYFLRVVLFVLISSRSTKIPKAIKSMLFLKKISLKILTQCTWHINLLKFDIEPYFTFAKDHEDSSWSYCRFIFLGLRDNLPKKKKKMWIRMNIYVKCQNQSRKKLEQHKGAWIGLTYINYRITLNFMLVLL